jgi:Peptidase family M23
MNDQPCSRPFLLTLFSRLSNPFAFRLQTYARFTAQLLPLLTLIDLWQRHSTGNDLLFNGTIFIALIVILPWDVLGVWLPYFYLALLFLVGGQLGGLPCVGAFIAVLSIAYSTVRFYPRAFTITLQFPLKRGTFYTFHGGAYPLTNYHGAFVKAQRYACDFLQLNALGTRAFGVYPRKLESYSIYDATVYSPCNGVILRCADGLPDLAPGQTDRTNAAGNHVIIRLDGLAVNPLLAHLKNGSVLVKVGDRVSTGQPIGKVGNSGATSEPHLHIHAQKQVTTGSESEWVGVPIRFGSRWLVRNSVVRA